MAWCAEGKVHAVEPRFSSRSRWPSQPVAADPRAMRPDIASARRHRHMGVSSVLTKESCQSSREGATE